jgi:hypothetical protein
MKWIPKPDEFFVGYLPQAPKQTSFFLRKIVIVLTVGGAILGFVLAKSNQTFSSNTFEYGVSSTFEGTLQISPVPNLRIDLGKDSDNHSVYQTILLVGFGKAGAVETLKKIENKLHLSLHNKSIKINGSLIYGDCKALLQVSDDTNIQLISDEEIFVAGSTVHELETVTIRGEIVDPKCYFGVMNPGEGKVHRSCAIRCISGGIPPVFYSKEKSEYFLLVGENFEPLNQEILNIVGDQMSLTGRTFQLDDWKMIQIENKELNRLSKSALNNRMLTAMETGVTLCRMN